MNVTDEAVSVIDIGPGDILLRVGEQNRELLKRAAKLDGFDDVGRWMVWFVTYWGSEFTAADHGDDTLANDLMIASMKVGQVAA